MKLKITQRIAIGYYKTKIKTIGLLSKRKAAEKAFDLFCTPYSGKPKRKAPPIFKEAEELSFKLKNLTIRGWQWIPENGNNKKILIVHGFDSCSYKFDKYIKSLTLKGFTVLAFDGPAHGISDGKTANALILKETLITIEKLHGKLYGIMAHSYGALAASLAAEEIKSLQKLILIAPATETTTAINNFFTFLPLGEVIKNEMILYMQELGNKPVTHYSASRAIQQTKIPTLWLHDEEDWICPYADVQPVQKLQLSHVQFYITKGLGHSKIYRDTEVKKKIIDFIVS